MKDRLWNMLMHNFLLRMPEVDNPAQEAAARLELEARVKKFALSKMAEQLENWKKNLYLKFVKVDKTPDFEHGYGNIREQWVDFVAYKKSEYAQQRSEINQMNAAKRFTTIKWGLLAMPVACLSRRQLRPSILMPGSQRTDKKLV